jgi:16S rRNA (guanine527-N7)-methyltransferase
MEAKDLLQWFPDIHPETILTLERACQLHLHWNKLVNLISRKDTEFIWERHYLHSLSLSLFYHIPDFSSVIDIGTGGGFPAIPLAILWPNVSFTAVDSIAKKVKIVQDIAERCGIKNIQAVWSRSEQISKKFDYVTVRAVTNLPDFIKIAKPVMHKQSQILYLKGGDFQAELDAVAKKYEVFHLYQKIQLPFFETKNLIQIFAKDLR